MMDTAHTEKGEPMKLINAELVLTMLKAFKDKEHGDPHFLNGIETAREIIEGMPEAIVRGGDCGLYPVQKMPVAFVVDQDIPDDICFLRETLGES